MTRPYLIGITGASGAGKTALAHHLAARLTAPPLPVIPLDAYYRHRAGLSPETKAAVNYDVPEAIDLELLVGHLRRLAGGRSIDRPTYDFREHARAGATERVHAGRFVVVEGLLMLHWAEVRAVLDVSVFILADEATSFARRLARDTRERGRTEASVRAQWTATVQPMYERYVEPTRRFADLVVSGTDTLEASAGAILAHVGQGTDSPPTSRRV